MASSKSYFGLMEALSNLEDRKSKTSNGARKHPQIPERIRDVKGNQGQRKGKFVYSPVNPKKKEIRLLKLKMSEDEDKVECSLVTASLESLPDYDALSYTWGTSDDAQNISLEGHPFRVTGNLYGALKNLQMKRSVGLIDYFKTHRCIWIDAICINQENIEERTQQVMLMWSIYSQASKVVVWLGEEYENSTLGMEMVRLLNLNFELNAQRLAKQTSAEGDGGKAGMSLAHTTDRRGDAEEVVDEMPSRPRSPQSPRSPRRSRRSRSPQLSSSPMRSISAQRSRSTSSTRLVPSQESQENYDDTVNETTTGKEVANKATEKTSEEEDDPGGNINLFWMSERPRVLSDPEDIAALTGESPSAGGVSEAAIRRLKPGTTLPDGRRILDEQEQSMVPLDLLLGMHNQPDSPDPEEWTAFQKLMERPWWQRIWVVQEVAAAKGIVLVGCGPSWLQWEVFEGAALTVKNYQDQPFFQALARFGKGVSAIMDKSQCRARNDGRLDSFGGLVNLLHSCRNYKATDPRDKVFALLGFTPSINFKPDYSMSVEEVYEKLIRTSIAETGCYMMLYLCRKPKKLRLPSWIPDFSMSMEYSDFANSCPLGFYGADGNNWHNVGVPSTGCALRSDDKPGHLTITGFTYDTPFALGATWEGTSSTRQRNIFSIITDYQALNDDITLTHFPHLAGQHRKESFWRTLIWNTAKDDRYPAPAVFGKYLDDLIRKPEFLGNLSQPIEANSMQRVIPRGEPSHYYEAMVRHGFRRKFFITKRGHLGSGPADMRQDDLICIVLGSKTPLVLRRVADGKHELVGHVYVHGIMHGEGLGSIVNDRDERGLRSLGLETFVLV